MVQDPINNHSIKATVTSLKGKQAILTLEDKQTLLWPSDLLPKDAKVGSDIYLTLDTEKTAEGKEKNLAKALLNEILGSQTS